MTVLASLHHDSRWANTQKETSGDPTRGHVFMASIEWNWVDCARETYPRVGSMKRGQFGLMNGRPANDFL